MLKSIRYKLLISSYKNKIYSYSVYMLRNRMDADDVTQEVLIRIWKNIDKFNYSAAGGWIMRTTHNLCLDYLRRRKILNTREFSIDDDLRENYHANETSTDPEITARVNIFKNRILEAVQTLPDSLKNVFVLYELQGLKYSDISEALNIPINTVKVYLLRARKKLQEELKEFRHETSV